MQIEHGRNIQSHIYELCGTILGSVISEKYLGVYLNYDLKWDHNIEQVPPGCAG